MPTNATYYLDAETFTEASAIYIDSDLNNLAPDGFYSDGKISRELEEGALLPSTICEECESLKEYRVVNVGDIVPVFYTTSEGPQEQDVPANGTIFVCSLTVPTGGGNLTITLENETCTQ